MTDANADATVEALLPLLRRLQLALLTHPAAAQAVFRALVREGRAFAQTDEGAAWRARIVNSEALQRGRTVWEGVTLNVFEAEGDRVLPSTLLDAFVAAAGFEGLESLFSLLYLGHAPPRDDGPSP